VGKKNKKTKQIPSVDLNDFSKPDMTRVPWHEFNCLVFFSSGSWCGCYESPAVIGGRSAC